MWGEVRGGGLGALPLGHRPKAPVGSEEVDPHSGLEASTENTRAGRSAGL